MSYHLKLFDWSLYALPSGVPAGNIADDSHANDPAHVDYVSGSPTWIGQDFVFNGGESTEILVNDDDGDFEDSYVETGGAQTLAGDITINGTTYLAGSTIENEFSMVDGAGNEVWVLRIDGTNVGFVYPRDEEPTAGETFTAEHGRDGAEADSGDGQASATPYATIDARDGIVTGTNGDDTIDAAYSGDPEGDQVDDGWAGGAGTNDNVVDAQGGDDVVDGGLGNDSIDGGSGNDSIEGGAGNDTLYGGDANPGDGARLSFNWSDIPDPDNGGQIDRNDEIESGSQSVNGVNITYNVTPGIGRFENGAQYVNGINDGAETIDDNSALDVRDTGTIEIDFSQGVRNAEFRVNNFDAFNENLVIRAYDSDGNQIAFNTTLGSNVRGTDTDTIAGADTFEGRGGEYDDDDPQGSLFVQIPGPVARIEMDFTSVNQWTLTFTDIYFDDPATDAEEAGDDTLFGGDGDDSIDGGAGDDIMAGDAGDDTIQGGSGDDTIFGDAGADSLLGGDGDDVFWDGTGDDYVDGGGGSDTFYTQYGGGNDTIKGGEAGTDNDQLISFKNTDSTLDLTANGTGADNESGTLTTSTDSVTFSQIESVSLSSGDDYVIGSAGNDSVDASYGADTIDGGAGDDTFNLGTADHADDLLVMGDGDGNDTVSGFEAPTDNGDGTFTGHDRLDVSDLTSDGGATPVYSRDVNVTDDGSGNAVLTFPGGESITLIGVSPAQVDDEAELQAMGIPAVPPETIHDAILLNGMPGDTDLLTTGSEMLQVTETLDFSSQTAGQLTVGDTVTIGGTVYSIGGLHDYEADLTSNNYGDVETISGHIVELDDGAGGTLTFMLIDDGYGPKPDINEAQLLFVDPATSPALVAAYDDDQTVTLSTLDYSVEGSGGADTIDAAYMGDPDGDQIDNNDHSDGSNDDLVMAGGGDDFVASGAGDDTVYGGDGADTLDGGAGDDALYGGAGNDSLIGGLGADTMTGGAGDDHFVVAEGDDASGGDGDDHFTLVDLGEAGNPTINISGGEGGETSGDTLQLNSDVTRDDITFDSTEDDPGGASGSFSMADGTWVKFTGIENIICFTPGARILTPQGERAIETLRLGDMVVTRDHGPQPVRWLGNRTVPGLGRFAPIRVGAGALDGARRPLLVSPQHRFLFTGYRAELLFGTPEVLVSAKHLVNGMNIRQAEHRVVTYLHLMFDTHEVIYADGVATESFHAGDIGIAAISDQSREEMFEIFPELRSNTGAYGGSARTCLKAHEALLMAEPIVKTAMAAAA